MLEHEFAQLGMGVQPGEHFVQMPIQRAVQQAAELGAAQGVDRIGLLLLHRGGALGDVALQVGELLLEHRGVVFLGVDHGIDHARQKRQEALGRGFFHAGKTCAVFGHAVEQLARGVVARGKQAGVSQTQTQHRNLQPRQLSFDRRQQLGVGQDVIEQQRDHVDGETLQRPVGDLVEALPMLLDEVHRRRGGGLVAPVHLAQPQTVGQQQTIERIAQLRVEAIRLTEHRGAEARSRRAGRAEAGGRKAAVAAVRRALCALPALPGRGRCGETPGEQLLQGFQMELRAGLRGVDQRLLVHRCGGGAARGRAARLAV